MVLMDNETGEVLALASTSFPVDVETGECVGSESDAEVEHRLIRKTKFNIPKSYLTQTELTKRRDKCCLNSKETYTLTSPKRVIDLKEVRRSKSI